MVSLWPWRTDNSSPASFERVLSKLSTQITSANHKVEATRTRARRAKALWTLYTVTTYTLATLILTLVLGPQKWSASHFAGILAAPVLIYAVRRLLTIFFDWRISSQQDYIESLQRQREEKIAELKKATRYDSTQELLQKYGGKPSPQKQPQEQMQGTKRKIVQPQVQRTGIAPPPTANIPGRGLRPPSAPSTPQRPEVKSLSPSSARTKSPTSATPSMDSLAGFTPDDPGFAPNAFTNPPPLSQAPFAYQQESRWYDRILDVLLGEDETLAKNRLVLICQNCRLVNGQAPPGVKALEEIGSWRCGGCGARNGVENSMENADSMGELRAKEFTQESSSKSPISADELSQQATQGPNFLEQPSREPENSAKITTGVPDSEEENEQGLDTDENEDSASQLDQATVRRVTRSKRKDKSSKEK